MWKKYKLWRQYDPFFTGWTDTMIFATILWFLGVFWAKQDPTGAMLVCFLGIGLVGGLNIGGLYSCCKSDWIDQCPYTRERLKKWRWAAEDIVKREEKKMDWAAVQRCALALKKIFPEIPYEYAHAAILVMQEKRTSECWVPKEGKEFRRENPVVWNIVDYV